MDDFYLTSQWLAAYAEAQWADFASDLHQDEAGGESSQVPLSFILSPFHTEVPELILQKLKAISLRPKSLLEVGSSLGRVNYEIVSSLDCIHSVYLVEPSKRLLESSKDILLKGGISRFDRVVARENTQFELDTSEIANSYKHLDVIAINKPATAELDVPECDLVVCLNVLDQCDSPNEIMAFLFDKVPPGGVLALSCSYQWNKKHLKNPEEQVNDIKQYFDENWRLLGENEFEYRFRVNERYSMLFLSHTVVFQREKGVEQVNDNTDI